MPSSDFPSTPKPDYPIDETPANPEILISTHKDGSEQRRYKGAGAGRMFGLKFGGSCPITLDECQGISDHFAARNGTFGTFNWQHPERTAETYLVRYVEAPSFTLVGYNAYQAQVKLKVIPA